MVHDNAPAHQPVFVGDTIRRHCKPFPFKWPACSYDLSPIDYYIFNQIKQHLEEMEVPPKKECEMSTAITIACSKLTQAGIDKVIDNFVTRCKLCLASEGMRFEHKLD